MLTDKQKSILDYIQTYLEKNGSHPSVRHIGQIFEITPRAVQQHLIALKKKGALLDKAPNTSAYTLTQNASRAVSKSIPLLGSIAAGAVSPALDDPNSFIELPPTFFGALEKNIFALTIAGDSMSGDMIQNGDIAIIQKQSHFDKKDILAVRVDNNEFTLKRLQVAGEKVQLLPSNPLFPVQTFLAERIEIVGKMVGLVRKLRNTNSR